MEQNQQNQQNLPDLNRFCCMICLDQLWNPVTILCGHSYCMACIEAHWNQEDEKKGYSCPQCMQVFNPRPVVGENIILAGLVEELKKTRLQAAPAHHCYAGAEDVACDVCAGRRLRASKSCLVCLASYCEEHLQPHHRSPPFKKHKLVEPSKNLQENICSVHDEAMKMFCLTDQQSICYICSVDQHKGHDTVAAAAERTQRQREVELSLQEIHQRVLDREKDLKVLQQEVEALNVSADKAVEDSEKIFTKLIHLLERRSSDVKQQIRSRQDREVLRVKDVEEKLRQEITELKRKEAELKQLSQTQDHNQFLLNCPSPSALRPSPHSSGISVRPLRHFEEVTEAVTALRGPLQDLLTETWTTVLRKVAQVDVLLPQPEPQSRAEFLQYSQEIFLDPNTVNRRLLLSEGNRKVTTTWEYHSYSRNPERFTDCPQVLSREALTGRCYWEVEWRGGGAGLRVAVAYRNISRVGKSEESRFGFNEKSWALVCNQDGCEFWHKCNKTKVSDGAGGSSSRIGVYLDHRAGLLSFYTVCDSMSLLHRVQTTFTQPLHAGLGLCVTETEAEFCHLG